MRFFAGIVAVSLFAVFAPEVNGSEVEPVTPEIRPFISNSTDELGVLQNLLKANKLRADGNCAHASRLYDMIVRYDPALEPAVTGLVQCQLSLGQNRMALHTLENSSVKSENVEILKILAKAKSLSGKERLLFLQDYVEPFGDSRLWNLLGESYVELSDFEKAENAYFRAEASGQSEGLLDNNLGVLELSKGNISGASSYFAEAIRKAPSERRFSNNHRLSLLMNEQYVEALDGLNTHNTNFFLYKAALIAEKKGEPRLARILLEKAIETSPTYFEAAERKLKQLG